MTRTFGERIYQFVLSSDIMDQELFQDLLALIYSYLLDEIEITYFSMLGESIVDGQLGLQTIWSTREETPSYSVGERNLQNGDSKEYTTYSGFVFGNNRPLWIVSNSGKHLQDAEDIIDHWSNIKSESLPQFCTLLQEKVHTAVLHPLTSSGRTIGVVEFTTNKYIKPTKAILEEVRLLASVIARAYQMYEVRRTSRSNTKKAMQILEDLRKQESWTPLALPQIFVAYSGTERLEGNRKIEHEEVIETILKVIKQFENKLKIIFWEDMKKSGDINSQVIGEITGSDFGITYFSEPVEQEPNAFQDNPNVLFEAGMMQALKNSQGAQLKGWIPIREKDSPTIPFDIAGERMLLVNRKNDGIFEKDMFIKNLHAQIKALIGEEDTEPVESQLL